MRFIFFAVLLCGAFFSVNAQTTKGSFMVGGSMSFQNTVDPSFTPVQGIYLLTATKTFTLSPNVGYFILDNWVVGLSPSISLGLNDLYNDVDAKVVTYGGGPFTRYYFHFGKFAAFPEVSTGWAKTTTDYKFAPTPGGGPNNYHDEAMRTSYKGGIGLAWFVASNVALEAILSYTNNTTTRDDNPTRRSNVTALNVGLQFFIPTKQPSTN